MTFIDPFATPMTTILPAQFTWKSIPGWMNYTELYDYIADRLNCLAPHPAVAVEVGAWFGQSTAYMASKLKSLNASHVQFFAVDTWEGTPSEIQHQEVVKRYGGSIFEAFHEAMKCCGVVNWVVPLQTTSVDASKQFKDASLDFVFIDADHTYEAVVADIRAWLPKVKQGGCIAGHDLDWDGVKKAVEQELGGRYRQWGACWIVEFVYVVNSR